MLTTNSPLLIKECPYYGVAKTLGVSDFNYIEGNATYRGVKPNRENMEISLKKCNVPAIFPSDSLTFYVFDLIWQYYGDELTQYAAGPNSEFYIKNSSSPGKVWKLKGCKTKEQALAHPDFPNQFHSVEHVPLMDYNGKTEFLSLEEILEDMKIRGTFNPPIDYIMKQKLIFDNQNKALSSSCNSKWIKHGFVKQYAGFHSLGCFMEQFDLHDEDDCSGYDRTVFLLFVYILRWKGFKDKTLYPVTFWYCAFFAIYNYVQCPDGVIRVRSTGNGSGSNNTTSDNCLFHLFVLFRFICKLWLKYIGRLPSLDEITSNHTYAIYSDDALGGHNISLFPGLNVDEFYELKRETYLEFGLKLKPAQHFISLSKGRINPKHSFLGSSFYYDENLGFYVPYPRADRIASGVKYTLGKAKPNEVFMKMFALTMLAAPVPELYENCRAFLNFLARAYVSPDEFSRWIHDISSALGTSSEVWCNLALGRE